MEQLLASERGPGRPREPAIDQRILDAAMALMARCGYARMSLEQVASEAGVTRPTIYRRYHGKIELALAAIVAFCDTDPPRYTGETQHDLIAQMAHLQRALSRPHGMSLLGTVLAEEHETPELLAKFREYLVLPRRHAIQAILTGAQQRNELRPDADLELATNLLVGAYYAQYIAGTPFTAEWPHQVVAAVWPMIAPPACPSPV